MPTEILAIGNTAASSADQVVASGSTLTVCLKSAAGPAIDSAARVDIFLKADNGEYFPVDSLTYQKPALMIVAPGTYRFTRVLDPQSRGKNTCGVFSG
ncbi:hypothetical protein [Bradyrhizobium sp. BR 10289]|uniref:hypothetical protein n=1 Tax=Bradyrhizobium sp. BR 10289 TaxID=2749993 RepID=UPI001C64A252|nr:hypothetical protein [Bradyrhizobium sp. BR 10289]MBW7968128.1 hypothetical protein [Bradyrhizobium sp. BR 10289]